ncbi:MAG: monovalent cation/H+ antiporter complex subunit F [Clostridiales bacterium]|nr:monovalent cation/H+ antiporter complex subunit F [Clostridiales bacterium]
MIPTILHYIYIIVLIILALMLVACLFRAVRGPRVADRLMSVNMMGTMVMVMISVLALMLNEGYLVDVCLIYAMISFLAVVVLSKVYIGIYEEKRKEAEDTEEGGMSDGNL